ncbi:MAG: ribokinase [Rhodospirillales bacterium]|nr:ribokinase [Rhodospirillales bacterium]
MLVIGSLNMDLVARCARLPAPGETVPGRDFATHPGGKGANQAVAAARMGAAVAMAGAVGDDAFGAALRAGLIAEGIDAAAVATATGPTGTALIEVADDGANSIVVVPGANATVDAAAVDRTLARFPTPGVLLLQHEIPEAAVAQAIVAGHAQGWFVVLNPAPARPVPAALMGGIDLIAPNETEAAVLLGQPIGDPAAAAAALLGLGTRAALITLGEKGAVWADPAGTRFVAPLKVAAVDSTAAGDAFLGALAAMLLAGGRIDEVLHVAAAAAALSVTRPGAQPSLPTRAEVEAFISRAAGRLTAE